MAKLIGVDDLRSDDECDKLKKALDEARARESKLSGEYLKLDNALVAARNQIAALQQKCVMERDAHAKFEQRIPELVEDAIAQLNRRMEKLEERAGP